MSIIDTAKTLAAKILAANKFSVIRATRLETPPITAVRCMHFSPASFLR